MRSVSKESCFFWTVPVPSVWSTVGPVPPDPVEPLCLVQLNLSLESWVHEHKFFSKLQSNDPLGGNVGAVVGAGVVGGRVGTALCGRVTHEPTVYVISSIAISPWYPFPLMPSKTIYEKKRFLLSQKIVANSLFSPGPVLTITIIFYSRGPGDQVLSRWPWASQFTCTLSFHESLKDSLISDPPPLAMTFSPPAFLVFLLPLISRVASFP